MCDFSVSRWHCIGPSCYYFPTNGLIVTKVDAVAACAAHGMHVWAPNSKQETDDVLSFIDSHPGNEDKGRIQNNDSFPINKNTVHHTWP